MRRTGIDPQGRRAPGPLRREPRTPSTSVVRISGTSLGCTYPSGYQVDWRRVTPSKTDDSGG